MLHDSLKSSLAFRKPATAVASRRPGRADGLMVGLDGHASLSAGRAPWRDGQAFLPLRRRPEGKVCRRARLVSLTRYRVQVPTPVLSLQHTQHVCGSVPHARLMVSCGLQVPCGCNNLIAVENIGVTADGEVVVGRRCSHRADVLRPRPQCPGSPPCPWLGPPWSLVP